MPERRVGGDGSFGHHAVVVAGAGAAVVKQGGLSAAFRRSDAVDWPSRRRSSAPVAFQIRAVPSLPPVTTKLASGLTATERTAPVWPSRRWSSLRVVAETRRRQKKQTTLRDAILFALAKMAIPINFCDNTTENKQMFAKLQQRRAKIRRIYQNVA